MTVQQDPLFALAEVLTLSDKRDEAEATYQRVRTLIETCYSSDHYLSGLACAGLGGLRVREQRVEDAERNPIADGGAFWSRVVRFQIVL